MAWLTASLHPGFAFDLTNWIATIERKGKLVQRVELYPQQRTATYRSTISPAQVAAFDGLIDAVDFEAVARASRQIVMDDAATIGVVVKQGGLSRSFRVLHPHQYEKFGVEPSLEPALRLWDAVCLVLPYRLGART